MPHRTAALLAVWLAFGRPAPAVAQGESTEEARLVAEEIHQDAVLIRRGQARKAIRSLESVLGDTPADPEARLLLAEARFELCAYAPALADAQRALADARTASSGPELEARCARLAAEILRVLGRPTDAVGVLEKLPKGAEPADAEGAWALGSALWDAGQRGRAKTVLARGAATPDEQGWRGLLARGRCQRRLGDLEGASTSYVAADEKSRADEGSSEPDVLAALGDVYFEADREVDAAKKRSPADQYRDALRLAPGHEAALLGLFRLHRANWQRHSRTAQDILDELLVLKPDSIEGALAGTSADLDDGQLKSCRERLARLEQVAPGRREVRTLRAALAWVEHREAECEKGLAELAAEDPADATPEREVGRHLAELYRFAEATPFARRATVRDEHDYEAWKELGRALADTGDEDAARVALDRAQTEAAGRQDAWRDNTRLVLKKMSTGLVREKHGELTFAWNPAAADVLRTYLVPFYTAARSELAARYGYTPGPTTIEVFDRHADFSVRSTGFEGFPALGVCFGPVVTSVSPLSEMRGTQSWARTSFHEFTHVIHLELSHNRCPRWITEGLATWEEENRNPTWTRNMRRELVDALANGDIIPVRDLNRAFRSSRILFGYYQGGLLCRMLIERRGFPPMVRIFEAFDRGLDIDQAFNEVYQTTPEALDRDFAAYVRGLTADLKIEPRWSDAQAERVRTSLSRERPKSDAGPEKLAAWGDAWCTVAWHAWQDAQKIDAQEALRVIQSLDPQPARAEFLRGEIALKEGDRDKARAIWGKALERAEDFRARIAMGVLAKDADENEAAEKNFLAAEKDFPGFDEAPMSAELHLSKLYEAMDRKDDSMRALERRLDWDAGAFEGRRTVAAWHFEHGRFAEAAKRYGEANEIDPFLRKLHRDYGDALRSAGRNEEALREYTVGPKVPEDLDGDHPGPLAESEQAEWIGLQAACLQALGRTAEAAERAHKALELDPACKIAHETLEKIQ
ncbi:MAG TPA: tetratricopeptide repeat protein [Planctomycetota bacterium]|nr:tetratricopeptide repeat protein [Planctomycetota bacterium]